MRPLTLPLLFLPALAAPVSAQPAPPTPAMELAVQTSQETGSPRGFAVSPRLTFAVGPDTAIDIGLDVTPENTDRWNTRSSGHELHVAVRERIWARDRLEVFGMVGVSRLQLTLHVPPYSYQSEYGSVTVPGHSGHETNWAPEVAAAVQYAILPRLRLRADGRIIVGERAALGAAVGVVTTLGQRPPRQYEQDSVRNGLTLGALSGAAIGGASFGFLYWALGEGDSRPSEALGAVTAGTLLGSAVGGILGAVIDHWIHKE